MELKSLIGRFFSTADKNESFELTVDDGLDFTVSKKQLEAIKTGKAGEWITAQYVALKMLEEQGEIVSFPDGFMMSPEVAVRLDNELKELFMLPKTWDGVIEADIKGKASQPNFAIDMAVHNTRRQLTHSYKIDGPFLQFSREKKFLLSPEQFRVFEAQRLHETTSKTEYDNLLFLNELQKAQADGCKLSLAHFNKLRILTPESITVEAELDPNGNLILTPNMGQDASSESVQRVLGQLNSDSAVTLKVGDEIVLFSPEKLSAVKEVISNRVVPKEQVKKFLNNPTTYIDASLVDLDLGFSYRVHGATRFKHAYFGETDESGIEWFGHSASSINVLPLTKLIKKIEDEATFHLFKDKLDDAIKTGASVMDFEGESYDISDNDLVSEVLGKIESKIRSMQAADAINDESVSDDKPAEDAVIEDEPEVHVVDIDLNDEELTESSPKLDKLVDEVSWKNELDWNNYARTPYPHQEVGVRWIFGLLHSQLDNCPVPGALLADDMGLGKTFMALSAVDHFYKQCAQRSETKKPTLIVAPLSLLENWRDEVDKTFTSSPFESVVILQSNADLNMFREGGVEIRGQQADDEDSIEPKYSLKVGKHFGSDRLDMPGRLVITTYQTLRDYQFSLCLIDWGIVVFDEAQNTKNPNALQTRAAKGLKAEFKLVATGTPVENSLADFWCLLDTAYPGYLGTYQEFRSMYITPIIRAAGDEVEEVRGKIGRELRLKVGALMLRRIKEDNLEGLPDKHLYAGGEFESWQYLSELSSTMEGFQREAYEGTIQSQLESDESHVLTTLQRLRDSSLHPRLADGGRLDLPKSRKELNALYNESGKLQSLRRVLDEIKGKGEKCIIFAVNKRLQSFLSVSLGQMYGLGPLSVINGDAKAVSKRASVPTRKTMIRDFEAREGFNIIVMSPVAAGVGLTVVGANHVIHLERHWNPAKEAQATDRVYRIGQEKDVHIYVPLLHHPDYESFDVNLHRLLTKKTLLKDAVVTPEEVIPQPEGTPGPSITGRITEEYLDKLSWQQFEALSVELLAKEYSASSAWLTKNGSDLGADGVIIGAQENVLIQAKYTQRRYDGYKAVQEVHAARPVYEKETGKQFDRLIFITNSAGLNKRTFEVAESCDVSVFERQSIVELLERHAVSYLDLIQRLEKPRLKI